MASKPGILTDWPWTNLGSFKYVILAPWAFHSMHAFLFKQGGDKDLTNFLILPFLLWRMLHNQIWISLSRYRTAKGNNRIVDKGIEFDQVDRESNWDDQILFNGILFYLANMIIPGVSHLPLWRTDGALLIILLHMGPVEFLYYWFHRALHHHYLYSRYHSHHHSSIVTEPITSWNSKHVVVEDLLPDGTLVRRGDRVTYFQYGMGRMEALWGKDHFEFKLDRWFLGNELKKVSPYKFPVFQAGPRVCLGKEMVLLR